MLWHRPHVRGATPAQAPAVPWPPNQHLLALGVLPTPRLRQARLLRGGHDAIARAVTDRRHVASCVVLPPTPATAPLPTRQPMGCHAQLVATASAALRVTHRCGALYPSGSQANQGPSLSGVKLRRRHCSKLCSVRRRLNDPLRQRVPERAMTLLAVCCLGRSAARIVAGHSLVPDTVWYSAWQRFHQARPAWQRHPVGRQTRCCPLLWIVWVEHLPATRLDRCHFLPWVHHLARLERLPCSTREVARDVMAWWRKRRK